MPEDVKDDSSSIPEDMTNQQNQMSAEEKVAAAEAEAAAAKAKEESDAKAKADEEAKAQADADASAKKKAAEEAKEKPLDTSVWTSTGSDVGDAVLTKLQNSGVTPEEAKELLYDAVVANDLSKIDNASLKAKVGDAAATIIMDGIKSFLADVEKSNTATLQSIYDVVGGKQENWNAVRDWAKENLSDEQRAEYADMINVSPRAANMAAKAMYEDYIAAGNTEFTTTTAVVPNSVVSAETVQPLTAAQYFTAVEKAHANGTYSAQREKLLAGRLAGKKQGI